MLLARILGKFQAEKKIQRKLIDYIFVYQFFFFFFFSILALYLEQDWRDIVQNSDQLSEKQQQQQTALWELAQTEVAYIKTLKVVTDVSIFLCFFFL